MFAGSARADSPAELVALWDFDETLTDIFGGREGSTTSDAPFDNRGRFGSALSNAFVVVEDADFVADLGDQFSISFWQQVVDQSTDAFDFVPILVYAFFVPRLGRV